MYTDQNGTTHYEADEYVERAAHFIKRNLPHIITVGVGVGLLVVAVRLNRTTKNIDKTITHALRVHDDFVQGMITDIPILKKAGREHTFYPGIGVWVEPQPDDQPLGTLDKLEEAVKNV